MTRTIAALAALLAFGCTTTTWRTAVVADVEPDAGSYDDGYLLVTGDLALEVAITRADERAITAVVAHAWRVGPGALAIAPDDAADAPADLAAHLGWTPVAARDGLTITVARADVRFLRRSERRSTLAGTIITRVALAVGVLFVLAAALPT